jgi:hypothetical protein
LKEPVRKKTPNKKLNQYFYRVSGRLRDIQINFMLHPNADIEFMGQQWVQPRFLFETTIRTLRQNCKPRGIRIHREADLFFRRLCANNTVQYQVL